MNEKDTVEGNKLIAEFMGWNFSKSAYTLRNPKTNSVYTLGTLRFHSLWDWLMPVVEKIESLDDCNFSFYIVQTECDIAFSSPYKDNGEDYYAPNFAQKKGNKLISTWSAVVEFIKWNNSQTKPTNT